MSRGVEVPTSFSRRSNCSGCGKAGVPRDIRQLLDDFRRPVDVAEYRDGLDDVCRGANRCSAPTHVSLDSRSTRPPPVVASIIGRRSGARGSRVSTDDLDDPAASALRRTRAELRSGSHDYVHPVSTLTVPLRGCRRALGSIVFEGGASRPAAGPRSARSCRRTRQAAVERDREHAAADDVIRSRRGSKTRSTRLRTWWSSRIGADTCSRQLRICHARQFSPRRADDRPLVEVISPELARFLAELEGTPPSGRRRSEKSSTRCSTDRSW